MHNLPSCVRISGTGSMNMNSRGMMGRMPGMGMGYPNNNGMNYNMSNAVDLQSASRTTHSEIQSQTAGEHSAVSESHSAVVDDHGAPIGGLRTHIHLRKENCV